MGSWQLLFIAPLLAVAYSDYRRHIIPNLLIYPMAIAGTLLSLWLSPLNLLFGLAGLTLGILLVILTVSKMGDTKLMAVVGLIIGTASIYAVVLAFIIGGVIAAILTLRHTDIKVLPFGVPLCASAVLVIIWQVIGS